jgi:hypothetical protein
MRKDASWSPAQMANCPQRPSARRLSVEALEQRVLLAANTLNILANLAPSGPSDPSGTVVRDSTGAIYSIVTAVGSQSNVDGIVKLAKGSSTPTLVGTFPAAGPFSVDPVGLLIDSNDNIFGVTNLGGDGTSDGTVFELPKGATSITTLAQFNQSTTGHGPNGNIVMDTAGNIYGVCNSGGTLGGGTVWRFDQNTNTITPLAAFPQSMSIPTTPGANGIAIDASGNIFGTTSGDPLAGVYGSVWKVGFGSNTIQTLATFAETDGSVPNGQIVLDSSDDIFGETQYGGANTKPGFNPVGLGAIYEVVNGSGAITNLASFDGTNGQHPVGGLVADASGDLFGVASDGGTVTAQASQGSGTVFEMVKGSNAITPVISFNSTNGFHPFGGVTLDSSGNIYGTTSFGGSQSGGTIFAITAAGGGGGGGGGVLTATVSVKSPASVVAGQKLSVTMTSALTNTGATTISESLSASVFLSADGTVDNNSIALGASGAKKITIAAHKHLAGHATIKLIPATTPAGAYHYIFEYKDSTGATIDAISTNTVTVAPPHIDLAGSFAKFISKAKHEAPVVETINVSNMGANVAASGTLSIVAAFLNTDGGTSGGVPVIIKRKIKIAPNKSTRIPLALKAPLTAGSYSILINLDASAITSATDSNLANNSFTSATALTVS